MSSNPLKSILDGIVSVEEIEIQTDESPHEYNALIFGEDSLFLVCFFNGDEDMPIFSDAGRDNYIVNREMESIDLCIDCGDTNVSGVSIVGSGIGREIKEKNIALCDDCFEEFTEEIDRVVERNSDKIVASNI